MKILLTGGAGYIGSHTAIALFKEGHEIFILDNFSNSHYSAVKNLQKILGNSLFFLEGEIENTELVKNILSQNQINAVIHFAGLKSVETSICEPLDYFSCNVSGSISLLKAMKSCGVRTLVFSSSATVYGLPKYLPYDENHPLNPINPYGRTKRQVEEILKDLSKSSLEWKFAILRYFNPVGAHESGLVGENPKGNPSNLLPYITQVVAGKMPYLNIYGNDYETKDGTGERDYIHVMDLAEGHVAALNFLENNFGCHVFNLGSDKPVSVLEIIKVYENENNVKIKKKIMDRRPGDLASYYADSNKAKNFLKWIPRRGVNEICSSTHKYLKSNKNS